MIPDALRLHPPSAFSTLPIDYVKRIGRELEEERGGGEGEEGETNA